MSVNSEPVERKNFFVHKKTRAQLKFFVFASSETLNASITCFWMKVLEVDGEFQCWLTRTNPSSHFFRLRNRFALLESRREIIWRCSCAQYVQNINNSCPTHCWVPHEGHVNRKESICDCCFPTCTLSHKMKSTVAIFTRKFRFLFLFLCWSNGCKRLINSRSTDAQLCLTNL